MSSLLARPAKASAAKLEFLFTAEEGACKGNKVTLTEESTYIFQCLVFSLLSPQRQ